MENHGIIIRHLRTLRGLDVRTTAKRIGRSTGWISEIENNTGTARITEMEFDRIVELLEGDEHRSMFKTWVANYKNKERTVRTFDGAVLRFIRLKKGIRLREALKLTGLSISYLSKLERGLKPLTLEARERIMRCYGYSPSSFKNLSTDPVRSKVVPRSYKLAILLNQFSASQIDEVFKSAIKINCENRPKNEVTHGT